jgi:hypothetical protein
MKIRMAQVNGPGMHERRKPLTMDLEHGSVVPIPCRHCGKGWMRLRVASGHHRLACPRCASTTSVRVVLQDSAFRVFTDRLSSPVRPQATN